MIYLECLENIDEDNWVVNSIHYQPFDEDYGLNKTLEELEETGFVVDIIVPPPVPKPDLSIGRMLYNEATNQITYEYVTPAGDPIEKNKEFIKLSERIEKIEKKLAPTNPDVVYRNLDIQNISLSELKEAKVSQLNYLCNESILISFTSNCLGIDHIYPFDYESQLNLSGTMNAYNSGLITGSIDWKTEDAGILSHTKSQFYKLYMQGMSHKKDLIATYWSLKTQVANAATKSEVNAIEW